jgi:hypothetical protein
MPSPSTETGGVLLAGAALRVKTACSGPSFKASPGTIRPGEAGSAAPSGVPGDETAQIMRAQVFDPYY